MRNCSKKKRAKTNRRDETNFVLALLEVFSGDEGDMAVLVGTDSTVGVGWLGKSEGNTAAAGTVGIDAAGSTVGSIAVGTDMDVGR